jgi:hypothetical protein
MPRLSGWGDGRMAVVASGGARTGRCGLDEEQRLLQRVRVVLPLHSQSPARRARMCAQHVSTGACTVEGTAVAVAAAAAHQRIVSRRELSDVRLVVLADAHDLPSRQHGRYVCELRTSERARSRPPAMEQLSPFCRCARSSRDQTTRRRSHCKPARWPRRYPRRVRRRRGPSDAAPPSGNCGSCALWRYLCTQVRTVPLRCPDALNFESRRNGSGPVGTDPGVVA